MMKPLLSLKHMCCQTIAIRFWWNPRYINVILFSGRSYYKRFKNVRLEHWISQLGLPKALEIDLYKIAISFISEPSEIISGIGNYDCFDLLDISWFSLNPTGGINYEETVLNIMKQPQVDNWTKISLAIHFHVFDPLLFSNFESFIDTLKDTFELNLDELCAYFTPQPQDILRDIPIMGIWKLKHTWKTLSQHDKEQLSGNLYEIVKNLKYGCSKSVRDFLLDNLFTDKINQFWKLYGSKDPVDKFCFNTQCHRFLDYLARPSCYLDQTSANLVKPLLALPDATLFYVLCAMIERIVFKYDDVLYQYLLEIWSIRSDIFKQNFCEEQKEILKDLLHDRGSHNLEYTGEILLLLQPFSPNLKANTSPAFIGHYLINSFHEIGPFMPPDNYLKTFVGSNDKIARLKTNAILMADFRSTIVNDIGIVRNTEKYKDIVRWALVTKEESEEYINVIHREAKRNFRHSNTYFVDYLNL